MTSQTRLALVSALALALAAGSAAACRRVSAVEALRKDFRTPPASARPWVYWFWLNGNITRQGITADLEAMKRAGIGGVLIMEVDQGAPLGPVPFNGPEWRDLFKHVCAEADRLGLEVNMNNDAGWCGSGGPWVTPELSMQRMVWTETEVTGPSRFDGALARPKAVADFYGDIVVWAFPTPTGYARIDSFREKAADVPMDADAAAPAVWPAVPPEETIARGRLVDLTASMGPDGRLAWDVPEGRWTILRLGHTSTGKDNHPAPESGRGLECDKLSRTAVEAHYNGLMGKIVEAVGPLAGKSLVATHIDSWEVGSQNWTPKFREEFQRLRGYDPLPFLPAVTGRIVDSREISERFLWDLRQTVGDLVLANYAGYFRELAHKDGLRLSIEAYTNCPVDEMAYAGRADEPMGEFWSWTKYGSAWTVTAMASAAHVYGKRVVGAEAFTADDKERWQGHPAVVKDLGDWAFTEGINRFVFHRYALQPWLDVRPGMSMGPWGLHYERTETWWEQSTAWHEYLARCQTLLQRGLFVADACLLGPEGTPETLGGQKSFLTPVPGGADMPRERTGYNFDTCPPEVVMTRMSVKNGRLVLPDGMSYRLLVLPRVETMTPALLARIRDLVAAGATIAGSKPSKSPSLSGWPACDDEVARLADELWGPGEAPAGLTERAFGKGHVFWSRDFQKTMKPVAASRDLLGRSQWIWYPEGDAAGAVPPGKRLFRREFDLAAGTAVRAARLAMTADNAFACWINGRKVVEGDDFKRVFEAEAASFLKPGVNVVEVEAVNGASSPNPAGLIGALEIAYADGRSLTIGTDKSWEAAMPGKAAAPEAFARAKGWTAAREAGPLGIQPWGGLGQGYANTDIYPDQALVASVLERMGVRPDFSFETESGTRSLRYIHRRLGDIEVYFVANKLPQTERALCTFRVRGRQPEIWRPDTGAVERRAVFDASSPDVVRIPLTFDPYGSAFVVFSETGVPAAAEMITSVALDGKEIIGTSHLKRPAAGEEDPAPKAVVRPPIRLSWAKGEGISAEVWRGGVYELKSADGGKRKLAVQGMPEPLEIDGPWDVRFAPGGGAPDHIRLDKLVSWSEYPNDGVRFYSGAATYTKTFPIESKIVGKGHGLWLDLGDVQVMARVKLNGKDLGILWKPPYSVDITGTALAGENKLEVEVVDLWINRQIGDEAMPEDSERNPDGTLKSWPKWLGEGKPSPAGRFTFTSWRLWHKGEPLAPSGLIGPVKIVPTVRRQIER